MIRSKKAMDNFTISLVVIISAVMIVILIMLAFKIAKAGEKQAFESRCKTSVQAYAKFNKLPFGSAASDAANIECPTQWLTIPKSSPRTTKRDVADLMVECWSSYGEGKLLLFKATDDKFCAICSVFQFEDTSVKIDRFLTFLMAEKTSVRTSEGIAPSYFNYIYGPNAAKNLNTLASEGDNTFLDGSKKYAVIFGFYKQAFYKKMSNALIAFAIAPVWAPVAFIGTSAVDWSAGTFLVEYTPENIKTVGCTQLPVSMVDKRFR
jgi:hypothetical protein